MTSEPQPIPRDHAPEQDDLRDKIDQLDEQAEAVIERAAGPEDEGESEDDVVPAHPAPEPPD